MRRTRSMSESLLSGLVLCSSGGERSDAAIGSTCSFF